MTIQTLPGDSTVAMPAAADVHYVDWGAIILGTVLASAISTVLFAFGTGIGLSLISPYEGEGVSKAAYFVALGLWTLWIVLSSFMAGGYLAGRLRRRIGDASEHEVEVRDGAHGLGVWGLGIVAASLLMAAGVSGVVGTAAEVAAPAAAVAANNTDEPNALVLDGLFREPVGASRPASAPAPAASSASETSADLTAAPINASPALPARDLKSDRAEIGRLLAGGFTKKSLAANDKAYVVHLVANHTGMSEADAQQRVDEVLAEAKRKAEAARKIGVLIAFATAVALIVAGAAAMWAATLGGKHRDENTDMRVFWRWR